MAYRRPQMFQQAQAPAPTEIPRQRMLADLLRAQGARPLQENRPGVPIAHSQGIAQVLQNVGAMLAERRAARGERQLEDEARQKRQEQLASVVRGLAPDEMSAGVQADPSLAGPDGLSGVSVAPQTIRRDDVRTRLTNLAGGAEDPNPRMLEVMQELAMRQQFPAQTTQAKPPASIAEYDLARSQGFEGTFEDWTRQRNQRFSVVEYGGQKYMVDNVGAQPPQLLSTVEEETSAAAQRELAEAEAGRGRLQTPTGEFEAVPGTEAAREQEAAQRAEEARRQSASDTAGLVSQDIDRALALLDSGILPKTGVGSIARLIPGTAARDLSGLLDTVKANVGFSELQAMREASPTGGALGQVSEREIDFLQALAGNLDLSQSEEQLRDNLNRLWNVQQDVIHGPGRGPARRPLSFQTEADQQWQQLLTEQYGAAAGGADPELDALLQKYGGAGG